MTNNAPFSTDADICNIEHSLLVCAAAGTGKTTALIKRYLTILTQAAARPAQIIAITFTDKAANEMRARLHAQLGAPDCPLPAETIYSTLEQLEGAPITTVHSFCLRLLRDNVALTGLDPQFQVIDDVEEKLLRRDQLERFFKRLLSENDSRLGTLMQHFDLEPLQSYLDTIIEKQNEWLLELERFVQAPPAKYLKNCLANARSHNHQLLKNFFSSTACQEALHLYQTIQINNSTDKLYQALQQFTQICNDWQNNPDNSEILTQLQTALNRVGSLGSQQNWYSSDDLNRVKDALKAISEELKNVRKVFIDSNILATQEQDIALAQLVGRLALDFITDYRTELNRQAKIDFDGIEQETVRLLTEHRSAMTPYVREFRHLLVDEFQDINPIQYEIITLLQELNPKLITFFVGDEKQSIYRFRGAEVAIFNRLRREQKPSVSLNTNYRSTPALMKFYNHFFENFLGKNPPEQPFEVHYPVAISSYKTCAMPEPPVECWQITSESEQSATPLPFQTLQAALIAQRIMSLIGQKIVWDGADFRPARYGDMVILLRARTHQSEIEHVLRRSNIPYFVVKGIGFYNQREIIDLVNFLRVLLNSTDFLALLATLRSPLVGASDRVLNRFNQSGNFCSNLYNYLFDQNYSVELTPAEAAPLLRFRQIFAALQPLLNSENTARILQKILDATHYLPFLAAQPNGAQMVANVKKLIDLTLEWEQHGALSPIDFIRRIQNYRATEIREGDASLASECGDAVRLMTIHAAKGLDFPIVFVPFPKAPKNQISKILFRPDLGLGIDYTTDKTQKKSELFKLFLQNEQEHLRAEDRRLLYVAATRAKDYLLILTPPPSEKNNQTNVWQAAIAHLQASSAKGLCIWQNINETELTSWYDQLSKQPVAAEPLPETVAQNLIKMLQPIAQPFRPGHLIATAFAEKISPPFSGKTDVLPHQETPLTATALGLVIHQIFSWWDFKELSSVDMYLAEVLKPLLLTQAEQQAVRNLIHEWAQAVLNPANQLYHLLQIAVKIEHEVELCGLFQDIILEGKTDLLLSNADGSLAIVDFKSDQVGAQPATELLEKYNAQLRFYAFILTHCNHYQVRDLHLYFIRNAQLITTAWSAALAEQTAAQIQQCLSLPEN